MDTGWPDELIPLSAIVLGIGAGIVSMVLKHRQKQALLQAYHRERVAAIECGMTEMPVMPPELVRLLQGEGARKGEGNEMPGGVYLLIGLVLSLAGLALYWALSAIAGDRVGLFGLLPAAVGLANLLYFLVVHRRAKTASPEGPPPAG